MAENFPLRATGTVLAMPVGMGPARKHEKVRPATVCAVRASGWCSFGTTAS